jgi:hypothetical protein
MNNDLLVRAEELHAKLREFARYELGRAPPKPIDYRAAAQTIRELLEVCCKDEARLAA